MNPGLLVTVLLVSVASGCKYDSMSHGPAEEQRRAPASPLDAEYEALRAEYLADHDAFSAAVRARQAAGESVEKCGYSSRHFFDRFEELADRGQPDAIEWCIACWLDAPDAAFSRWVNADKYYESFRTLIEGFPDSRATENALNRISLFCGEGEWMRADRAIALCQLARDHTSNPRVKTKTAFQEAALSREYRGARGRERSEELLRQIVGWNHSSESVRQANAILLSTTKLQPGQPAPDFTARDTEGEELRLSDFRGKVVVLDFWSFNCGFCVAELPETVALCDRLRDAPFALIGIVSDEKLDEFRSKAAAKGVNFRNIWPGGYDTTIRRDFAIWREPTIFVLDGTGTIRFVDARGKQLAQAVDALLAEATAGTGSDSK